MSAPARLPAAIKICGISTPATLDAAIAARADHVGFVFFARSPRALTPRDAALLGQRAAGRIGRVGLFVDPTDSELEKTLRAVRLDMIQLHGKETPARVDAVRLLSGLPVMKALGIETARDLQDAKAYQDHADWLLFDAKPPQGATLNPLMAGAAPAGGGPVALR